MPFLYLYLCITKRYSLPWNTFLIQIILFKQRSKKPHMHTMDEDEEDFLDLSNYSEKQAHP